VALLALGAFTPLLNRLAGLIGIEYPPSALFLVAFGFVLVLLLHFSVAVSRLADQSKVMAQRVAMLEERLNTAGIEVPMEAQPRLHGVHTREEPEQQPAATLETSR
jgi:hypothetical protein